MVVEKVSLTDEAAELLRRLTEHARPADVPPVRWVLRRQFADVLPGRGIPDRGRRTCISVIWSSTAWTSRSRSGCPKNQYEYWKHTQLTVDVVKGRGSGFSVEAPEGVRFLIRSRLFTDQESAALGLL